MASEELLFTTDVMGYFKEAKELYPHPLTAVRETLQNTLDSHSTRFTVVKDHNSISLIDDGDGMTLEFLKDRKNGFLSIGAAFKRDDTMRGNKGRGRLALLAPMAELNNGEIVYTGRVEIYTASKGRASKAVWKDFRGLDSVEDMGPTTNHGTTIKLIFDNGVPESFDMHQVKAYLEDIAVNVPIEMIAGKETIPKPKEPRFKASGKAKLELNSNWRSYEYPFQAGLMEGTSTIKIAENGLLAKHMYTNFPIGGYIDFGYAKTESGENVGIVALGRNDTLVKEDLIARLFITEVLLPYYKSLPAKELQDRRGELVKLIYTQAVLNLIQYNKGIRDLFLGSVVIDGKSIAEWMKDRDNVVWTDRHSKLVERARPKGYKVLITDDAAIQFLLKTADIRDISEIKDELAHKAVERTYQTPEEEGVLNRCASALQLMSKVAPDRRSLQDGMPKKNGTGRSRYVSEAEALQESGEVVDEVTTLTKGIEVGGTTISFAEAEDQNLEGFFYKGNICLNTKNPNVAQAIEEGNMDYIEAIVCHEWIHKLGWGPHDEGFASALTTLMGRYMTAKTGYWRGVLRRITASPPPQPESVPKQQDPAKASIPADPTEKLVTEAQTRLSEMPEPVREAMIRKAESTVDPKEFVKAPTSPKQVQTPGIHMENGKWWWVRDGGERMQVERVGSNSWKQINKDGSIRDAKPPDYSQHVQSKKDRKETRRKMRLGY
jgi:hypothetical protein